MSDEGTYLIFAWQNTKKLHILISNQELMKEDTTHFLLEEVGLLWLSPNSATFTSKTPCYLASPRWRNGFSPDRHPLFFFSDGSWCHKCQLQIVVEYPNLKGVICNKYSNTDAEPFFFNSCLHGKLCIKNLCITLSRLSWRSHHDSRESTTSVSIVIVAPHSCE